MHGMTNPIPFTDISPTGAPISFADFETAVKTLHDKRGITSIVAPSQISAYNRLVCNILGRFQQYSEANCLAACRVIGAFVEFDNILPVVEITLPNNNGTLTLRTSMRATVISCDLAEPLPVNSFGTIGYFRPHLRITPMEFPKNRQFPSFGEDQQQFTLRCLSMEGNEDATNIISGICDVLTGSPTTAQITPPAPAPSPLPPAVKVPHFGDKFKMKR